MTPTAPTTEDRLITSETYNEDTQRSCKYSFTGHVIIGSTESGEEFPGDDGSSSEFYSVAVSQMGRLILLHFDSEGKSITDYAWWADFATFAEVAHRESYPPSLAHAIAHELGVEFVEDLGV